MTHDEKLDEIWKRNAVGLEQLVAEAVAKEREMCAKVADEHIDSADLPKDPYDAVEKVAAAIRARGQ